MPANTGIIIRKPKRQIDQEQGILLMGRIR